MNKFVIVKNMNNEFVLRYANIDFHKMMVHAGDEYFGGGMFFFNDEKNQMELYGKSEDFGAPQFDKIKEKIHIDEELQGMKIVLNTINRKNWTNEYEDLTKKFIFDWF